MRVQHLLQLSCPVIAAVDAAAVGFGRSAHASPKLAGPGHRMKSAGDAFHEVDYWAEKVSPEFVNEIEH